MLLPALCRRLITSDLGGLARLVCGAGCGFVHWDNPAPVLAALVEYQGRILLARNRAWAPGVLVLITGFLERDEKPAAGVAREVSPNDFRKRAGGTGLPDKQFSSANDTLILLPPMW